MIRLAVRVARERAEVVAAELLALSPGGLEERDVDTGTVELAIYGAEGELPDLGRVRALAGGGLVDVEASRVPEDWEERWRRWHRPFTLQERGRRVRVRPPWEPAGAEPGTVEVVIDPGQAFGTGAHPSTRLALALLLECEPVGPLADWGCGSGLLAVAGARLGFWPVVACDIEPAAVAATLAAAAAHGIPARAAEPPPPDAASAAPGLTAGRLDLRRAPGPWAPTVAANLVRPLLLAVAATMERPPERLIASGLTAGEVADVAGAFARHGLAPASRRDADGWSAILLAT